MTHRQEQILPFSFGTTIKENQNTRGRTMGLQNIFDMVKAERYTQDGREEIIKAQKETEDARRTYKNGEISEKTGLMKTANGWVKPPANKGAGAGKGAEADNKAVREAVHEMNMKSKEDAANRAYERRQKEHDPDYKPEGKKALKLPDEKSSFQTDVNRMKKLKQQDYKQYTIQLEKLHSKYPINKWTALYDKTTRDSAPLTGDCKIRVRKS